MRNIALVPVICGALVAACGASPATHGEGDVGGCACEVVFSVANQDRQAPTATMDVLVDGRNIIHGPLMQTGPGEYLYFSTCLRQKKVEIEARSSFGDQQVHLTRSAWMADHVWIVITRVRDLDGQASLALEVSYEEPAWHSSAEP